MLHYDLNLSTVNPIVITYLNEEKTDQVAYQLYLLFLSLYIANIEDIVQKLSELLIGTLDEFNHH